MRQRQERIKQIRDLGFEPYGRAFDFTHTIPEILSEFGETKAEDLPANFPVRIAGRVKTMPPHGESRLSSPAAEWPDASDLHQERRCSRTAYRLYEILDIGDIIGVTGYLFRTRTGELSVHVEDLVFLSKIMLPLPEKWHGLEDVETRYRQRYVDLIANPEVRNAFVTRAKIVRSLRRQLDERGFLEVETPIMQPLYGGAAARPFVTHHNTLDLDLYLRIAPELYLKRLVVGGIERVYELNRNFRNEGISTRHNPEFTMLEFYQAYTDFRGMMELSKELLAQVAVDATGSEQITYQGQQINFGNIRALSMREAIIEYWPEKRGPKPSLEQSARPRLAARPILTRQRPGMR